jgi:nicotinamide mononucleotide transporter
MSFFNQIELVSVILSLIFLLLLMRESIWCWPFGILGSALGAFLFVAPGAEVKLYSEAILYSYYVWVGIYGWIRWSRPNKVKAEIRKWSLKQHIIALSIGAIFAPSLGFLMGHYLNSNNPYLDAATTVFSFIASYMQAEKILSSWHFWIVINTVTIGLYLSKDLYLYSALMVVYLVMSAIGLHQWQVKLKAQLV